MQDLEFKVIREENKTLLDDLNVEITRLLRNKPKGFLFELTFDEDNVKLDDEVNVYFIVRGDKGLLGYASCYESNPNPRIGNVSRLLGLRKKPYCMDLSGKRITRENLSEYPGYCSYTGKGKVLHLGTIDIFKHRKGIGTKLIRFIKPNYELIEADTATTDFFKNTGFIDTTIDTERGDQVVMVWNNPDYK